MKTKMIEKYKTTHEIKEIVERLGNSPMRKGSHGYGRFGAILIRCAAQQQAENFANGEGRNAAIVVMEVVLAANRNFNNQVEPYITKVRQKYPFLTFEELNKILSESEMDYKEFAKVWGHKDEKKYKTLKELVKQILEIQSSHPSLNDFETMTMWAKQANPVCRKKDSLGRVANVGLATFQHLRIAFGINTVKPDQRVREVLTKEFGAKLSADKTIVAVEEIAEITGYTIIVIEQIFVKYGSGYY